MGYNKAIDQFISYCLEPHEVKTSKKSSNFLFWVKGGEVIVEIENSKYFRVRYDIWNSIFQMFDLNLSGTQSVIKVWLEQHYNLGELTPAGFPQE